VLLDSCSTARPGFMKIQFNGGAVHQNPFSVAAPGSCERDWRGRGASHTCQGFPSLKGTVAMDLQSPPKSTPRQVGPERVSAEPRKARSGVAGFALIIQLHNQIYRTRCVNIFLLAVIRRLKRLRWKTRPFLRQ
jgi:hypothetical protein